MYYEFIVLKMFFSYKFAEKPELEWQQGWSLAVGTLSLFHHDVTQRAPR